MIDLKDILLDEDGDIFVKTYEAHDVINGNVEVVETYKDFSFVYEEDCTIQNIKVRLKTNVKELILHPQFGNKLREIIGQRNTRQTAELASSYLASAICDKNYIKKEMVTITAIPQDSLSLLFLIDIEIDDLTKPIRMVLDFGLQDGVRRFM